MAAAEKGWCLCELLRNCVYGSRHDCPRTQFRGPEAR
uniref:Uncharacterized protein n=1 Tax=Capra hircus TaxID=9925 RepID=A0A8C2RFB5_CAPHI